MEVENIAEILRRLRSREASEAWTEFLQAYTPVILQVVGHFEHDPDHISDCFLYVCEQLCKKRFRRLRRFRADGPARFSTWLRAVVRNLCLDWHRREFGRYRVNQSVAKLGTLDQQVFRSLFIEGLSLEETLLLLQQQFPSLTHARLEESEQRIRQSLTSRQLWLLSQQRPRPGLAANPGSVTSDEQAVEIADPGPNPETQAKKMQERRVLGLALARLPSSERLLLQLRFEQDLTLEQVARLAGLSSPQAADRKIRDALGRLRKNME